MKRILAVTVLACALTALAVSASASTFRTENLAFRSHKATAGTGETLARGTDVLCTACFVSPDSLITSRLGVQACVLDTTVAVITEGWDRPIVSGAALDTMNAYCVLHVADATGASCQASADSIYVAAQGSVDGLTWTTLGTFKAGTPASITSRLDQTQGTGTFFGLYTKSTTAYPTWQIAYKLGILSANQTADVFSIQRWPQLRWIIGFPDAVKYTVRAYVTHRVAQ